MEMKKQTKLQKSTPDNTKIPYTDPKLTIYKFIDDKWQKSWTIKYTSSTIYRIPLFSGWQAREEIEKEQVILSRLCIGHMHNTLSHLLKREDTTICSMYKVPLSLKL